MQFNLDKEFEDKLVELKEAHIKKHELEKEIKQRLEKIMKRFNTDFSLNEHRIKDYFKNITQDDGIYRAKMLIFKDLLDAKIEGYKPSETRDSK